MEYVTSALEAKEIDRVSMEELGMPSPVLMERAALSLAEEIKKRHEPEKERILVVCGSGNNGGDGVAAARMLSEWGYVVTVWFAGNREHTTEEMKRQLTIATNCGVKISTQEEPSEYTIIIDALFGIGLSREVQGKYQSIIEAVNDSKAVIYAVDIASGVDATTGKILGVAIKADVTVTFGTAKRGHFLFPGTMNTGELLVKDIGFPKAAVKKVMPKAITMQKQDILHCLPERKPRTNKGSYGKVLVIAGCETMSGACYLCAKAAYRMGCGLVKIATAKENLTVLKTKLPEAIIECYDDGGNDWFAVQKEWADVIVFGPGIGKSDQAKKLLEKILTVKEIPVVIDADGINLLAEREACFLENKEAFSDNATFRMVSLGNNFVLTPHLKEMSRLCRLTVGEIRDTLCEVAEHAAVGATIVLKDARTVVAGEDFERKGKKLYINTTGNNALSTGGSGDVLAGIIGGLLAQGMDSFHAASLGALVHGATAENYLAHGNRYSMMASDIIEELNFVCRE